MVRYLLSDAVCSVPFRDCEVMAEQFDDRKIGSCLAVRDGSRFKHEPIRRHMGMRKLIDQARFTHARLADHGKYLAASASRLFYELLKGFDLGFPSDKRRKPTRN